MQKKGGKREEGNQPEDLSASHFRWTLGPSFISAHPSVKGKPSTVAPVATGLEASEALTLPDGTPRGMNSLQALPTPRLRRAPGQRSRGQGEALTGCTCTSWRSSEEGEEAHVCPERPAHALSGRYPSEHPSRGMGRCVHVLQERGRRGGGTERNRKGNAFIYSISPS